MKKFTKGCLITGLVLFIFGCAFWGICGYMGGFRQLDDLHLRHGNILGIGADRFRWGYLGDWFDIISFWDEDWWLDESGTSNLLDKGDKISTHYTASSVTEMDIELGGCNLVIKESEDDCIWLANDSRIKDVKYSLKNGVFKLYFTKSVRYYHDITDNGSIWLYLPKGMDLNAIDMEIGAGKMESMALSAKAIDLDAGAGNFVIEGLSGDDINILVGAGKAEIHSIQAENVYAECGAGEIKVDDLISNELTLEAGMGNMVMKGDIYENADIKCNMGNIKLTLQGAKTDYDYDMECSMGNLNLGGEKYSGVAIGKDINNGNGRLIEIECAAGNITIDFER